MIRKNISTIIKHTPLRVLLPTVLLTLLLTCAVFIYLLPSIEEAFLDHKKETIHELAGSIIHTLSKLHAEAGSSPEAQEQAKIQARELIRAIRYGDANKNYFWINDDEMRMVMHPYRPDLEGSDLSDFEDMKGKKIFREFLSATDQGGGYVSYHWQWHDQQEHLQEKVAYVREFAPWGWIVGTGFYLNDVMVKIDGYRNRLALIFVSVIVMLTILQYYIMRQTALTEARKNRLSDNQAKLVNALKAGEERYRTIADFAYDWELWIGTQNEIHYSSPSCLRITGHPPERFMESPELMREMILEQDQPGWDAFLKSANCDQGAAYDFRIRSREGDLRWLGAVGRGVAGIGMKPLGVRCSFRDITEHKGLEEKLRHQALHDPLTGLANRTLCLDRIGQAMSREKRRENYYFAVVFLDLDRFKVINDSLGHRFGDLVLVETAQRLSTEVRALDTVSRFGGDEFVLLLDELASPSEAIRIVKRIRKALSQTIRVEGQEILTTASFGIVFSPVDNVTPQEILQNANIAMHYSKEAGRNRFKVFTGRMLENAVAQLTLETDLRNGLKSGNFYLKYQPIMNVQHSRLVGFEALARWNHPRRGSIPPSEFIPVAEETGAILPIGEWVLTEALTTLAQWRENTPLAKDIFMSVNLSAKQFAKSNLDTVIIEALAEARLPASVLKLEITESAIMDYPDTAVRTIRALREHGVRFSIDDFGTGYSSLSQLQRLDVDTLKVDRSFVARMEQDQENREIVRAVIALAHSLNLDVIAEGVEEPEQLCSLLDLNCECVQGFYFHKPLSTTDAEALIKTSRETTTDEDAPSNRCFK